MSEYLQPSLLSDAEKQLHTTHISNSLRIHYPHHPYFGDLVEVIRTTSTFGPNQVQVLLPNGNQLVIPRWMLDEERCQAMQVVAQPIVTVNALFALRDLLRSQRFPAEEILSSSDKCLHGGVSIDARQTRATLRGKCNSETPGDCAPAMPRVIEPDVPSRDRRHSQDQRGRKK